MALNPAVISNIAGSKITVIERFLKLYRKLHNLFLKRDFVNVTDFETVLTQINTNLTKIDTNLTKLYSTVIGGHIHVSPFLGLPTGPGLPAGPIAPPTPHIPVKSTTAGAEARDAILQATGEPVVPIETPI